MATASPAGSGGGSRRRVLLFPVPFQGHLTPMLLLAGALHARGGGGLVTWQDAYNIYWMQQGVLPVSSSTPSKTLRIQISKRSPMASVCRCTR